MSLFFECSGKYESSKYIYQEICQMMVAILGDYKIPLPEVVYLIEKILKNQIQKFVNLFYCISLNSILKLMLSLKTLKIEKAENISNFRNSKFVDLEDFIFLFRNDTVSPLIRTLWTL